MEPLPYAALINRKLVIPSEKLPYFAVERHFFQRCLRSMIAQIKVDEPWYAATYTDVAKAVAEGVVQSPREHYIRFGYFEHRMPYRIEVDEDFYLDAYADVRKAIEKGEFDSAQLHFDFVGFQEGRLPFANFSLLTGRAAIVTPSR